MTVTEGTVGRAEAILRAACGERVRTRFELAALTTFRIGGPANLFWNPSPSPIWSRSPRPFARRASGWRCSGRARTS